MTDPFAVVPIQINLDPRLTFRDVKVLIALLSFRNGKSDETVWPTRRALSERCNLPEQRISAVTTRLVSLGWLTKTGKGGFSRSTRYDVTIPGRILTLDKV